MATSEAVRRALADGRAERELDARVEAVEQAVELLHDLVRDSRAECEIVFTGITRPEWDDLDGGLVRYSGVAKRLRLGPITCVFVVDEVAA